MSQEFKCEICDRTFKDADGLAQHNAAKHPLKEKKKGTINSKKIRNLVITILVIGIILALILWSVFGAISESKSCKTDPVTEINIGGHTNIKLHIHSDLRILIDGKEEFIPANIGIGNNLMRPLHTHNPDGEIHIEGPCARDFTIGEFFQVWGREFNRQCIFDKCTDNGVLRFIVNGKENQDFENYIMRDGDNMVIEYNSLKIEGIE